MKSLVRWAGLPSLIPAELPRRRAVRSAATTVLLAAAALTQPLAAVAQDERQLGWSFQAELSSVFTGGNQASRTFGAGALLRHLTERGDFRVRGATVFQESGVRTRRAIGTSTDYQVQKETRTEKTAESFNLRTRYDVHFSDRAYALSGVDWLRNTFAGIDSRLLFSLGAGNGWADRDAMRFKTDYALTYTFQSDVVDNPFVKQNFPGVRAGYELFRTLSGSANLESEMVADWNLDDTDDVRVDWTNALPVSISSRLALKPSLRLLWRNQPALTSVDLFDATGAPTGELVVARLQKLDTFFTLALVVTL